MVGVNTAIVSPSGSNAGIGFAIPIDAENRVVPQLIRDGHVATPGIGIVAANEAAEEVGVGHTIRLSILRGADTTTVDLPVADTGREQ